MTFSVARAHAELQKFTKSKDITVTICGGGNGAHVASGYLSSHGITVNVLTRKPDLWGQEISVDTAKSSWEHKGTITGRLNIISAEPKSVIPNANVVIVAAPANAHPEILQSIAPFVTRGTAVGALFAQVCKHQYLLVQFIHACTSLF